MLPLGESAPIFGTGVVTTPTDLRCRMKGGVSGVDAKLVPTAGGSSPTVTWQTTGATAGESMYFTAAQQTLVADLTAATAATVNQVRLAFQTQRFYEKQARGGTRYTEVIKSHFDVVSPDMRLQRPEYIGGGSTPVMINPVAQTAPTSGSNALGQLGAYGVCAPDRDWETTSK